MTLTENGISTTTERDCFRYETFRPIKLKCTKVMWDYRDASGELHSGVANTLDAAKDMACRFGYRG